MADTEARAPNGSVPGGTGGTGGALADELSALLARSAALPVFRNDVAAFLAYRDAPRVTLGRLVPRVKVARVLAQLLAEAPALRLARVRVDGESGCADFRGTLAAECADGVTHRFAFRWDCRWRAEREGWRDAFGAPDQARAAATFGWRCFAEWTPLPPNASAVDVPAADA